MDTRIVTFCNNYLEKLKADKDIAENQIEVFEDYRDRIGFSVHVHRSCPNIRYLGQGQSGYGLFFLDNDDLKYLYDKYSKKVDEEMQRNIDEVKQVYKKSEP
jgi:uncharacterized protein YneR